MNRRRKRPYTKKKKKRDVTVIGAVKKNKKGFGFIELAEQKIFIPSEGMNGAMDGDMVEAELIPEYFWHRNPEAIVVKVKKRANEEVVGTFQRSKKFGFVVPDNKNIHEDIFVDKKNFKDAGTGDKVVCKIIKYPDKRHSAEGKITEIIAKSNMPGGDIKSMIRQYGLTPYFSEEVKEEAKEIQLKGIELKDMEKRLDLRDKTVFTIDGADSKDFDDAVSIEKNSEGNFVLGVHIADVAGYVKEGSALDEEAFFRGNSIYLIDTVIPMLPEELSNDICSLNPHEDRLTVSCIMEINHGGNVINHNICESIIRSKERLVYDDISDILEDGDNALEERYKDILPDLFLMGELKRILTKRRIERGSLDFDLDEAKITLDKNGIAKRVDIAERRFANEMIEEFMLMANETVAREYFGKIPFVYRVHDKPEEERLRELRGFLFGLGFSLPKGNITPGILADVLTKSEESRYEQIIRSVVLRAMQKAVYSEECLGHFGLALKYYCHFTSPIRRYPDLMIHRIIKGFIKGELSQKDIKNFGRKVKKVAEQTSERERLSIELERGVESMKKAEYMSYHIGEEYDGIISGVTSFGVYVRLENTIEGMIKIDNIGDDYFDYDEKRYRLVGRRSNKTYTLGDEVHIKVEGVNIQRGEIDFIL